MPPDASIFSNLSLIGTILIASGQADFAIYVTKAGAFATNGYGAFSPGGYTLLACMVAEVVLTFFFLVIIMGATHKKPLRDLHQLQLVWD